MLSLRLHDTGTDTGDTSKNEYCPEISYNDYP